MAGNYYASIYDTIRFEGEYSDDDSDEDEEPVETMTIPPRPSEVEEGEIVEGALDIYPNDLLEPEPFIRAPIISYDAAVIMADEFPETYLGTNRMEYEEKPTIWDIQDQERDDYEAYLLEMAEQAEMEYDEMC